jgi:nucleotide-binding universal stress UspA family protein
MADIALSKIGVALDGSGHADHALDMAMSLARRYSASLVLISVVPLQIVLPMAPGAPMTIPEDLTPLHDQLLANAKKKAEGAGIRSVITVRLEGHVVDTLVSYLEQNPLDLMVMGSRGLSAPGRLFLGSVSDALVHHAPCPVLIARETSGPARPAPP